LRSLTYSRTVTSATLCSGSSVRIRSKIRLGGETLLSRRGAVSLKDGIDEGTKWPDCWPLSFALLTLRRLGIRQSLAHHSAMYSKLVRHSLNRPDTELVFPANLLEQLHLRLYVVQKNVRNEDGKYRGSGESP